MLKRLMNLRLILLRILKPRILHDLETRLLSERRGVTCIELHRSGHIEQSQAESPQKCLSLRGPLSRRDVAASIARPSIWPPRLASSLQESKRDSSSVQNKMKIFNWVHRKLSNKEENAGKKNGSSASVVDDHHHHDDQLWSGGILSIGTFGYDHEHNPLLLLKQGDHEETYYDDDAQNTIDHNYIDSDSDDHEEEEQSVVENHEIEVGGEGGVRDLEVNYSYNSKREFEYVMMEKTARITLADLFSADHPHHHHQENVPKKTIDNNNDNANTNHSKLAAAANGKKHVGLSSTSTKIKHMVEEAPSIHKKLHHMMRRMLKRKIHPDLVAPPPPPPMALNSKAMEANDNASLLPTQDSAI